MKSMWIARRAPLHISVCVAVLVTTVACSNGSGSTASPASPDEAAIREAVSARQEAANHSDFAAWATKTCESWVKLTDRSAWGKGGPAQSKVNSVRIDGNAAHVNITQTVGGESNSADITFIREGGAWKWCGVEP